MSENKEMKTCGECKKYKVDCIITAKASACDSFEQKVITNGDKLRQMSDEELTLLIVQGRCRLCPYGFDGDCYNNTAKSCKDIILEQLKHEAKDE